MAALRPSSRLTTDRWFRSTSDISTLPTAPSTIFERGGDDSPGLLALEHGGGDIRGVGEMGDAGFGHLDPTDGAAGLDLGLQPLGS